MDFSFKDKFCKHFVSLRQFYNEVHVSFNIDRCLPSRTDKIKISLFHDEKLDVEKKKKLGSICKEVQTLQMQLASSL